MSLLLRVRGAVRASQGLRSATQRLLGTEVLCAPSQAVFTRECVRWTPPTTPCVGFRMLTTTASDAGTQRDALVEQLRPLCKAVYSEHRATQTVDELLAQWETQISTLLASDASETTTYEVAHTYEQGMAIAYKQREFALADALFQQMQTLGVAPRDAQYKLRIGAVPLQWVSLTRSMTLEELRKLKLGKNWETAVLELVRAEDQPHYRKSPAEQQQFHAFVRDGVAAILAEYETAVPTDQQHITPYNAAVRAYASSGLPFKQMLRVLNQIPQDSSARRALNVHTFLALLHGARWSDIPLTIERLVKSNVLRVQQEDTETDGDVDPAQHRSHLAALVWDHAMRAICNSYNESFFDKRKPLDTRHIRELQTIFLDVEAQLLRAFPDKKFATIEDHEAVYEIRVKTAALLGLPRQVHWLLKEYKTFAPVEFASGQLSQSVFFKALEIFPSVALKRVHGQDIGRVRSHPDVLEAAELVELQRKIEDLEKNVIPVKKAKLDELRATNVEADDKQKTAGRELRKAQQTVLKLKKRLEPTAMRIASEVGYEHRMRAADRSIEIVLEHLVTDDNTTDLRKDLNVAVSIMTQYMTTANRFATRTNQETKGIIASLIMRRVFELLDVAVGQDHVELRDDDRAKVEQLFSLASKTAGLFWCDEDLERLMHRKKVVLGTTRLDAEDYDRLVFMRVAQRDITGAIELLQEMHYAGLSPTPTTIHRVVNGVLHKLYRDGSKKKKTTMEDVDDMEIGDDEEVASSGGDDGFDDEEVSADASWNSRPSRLEDTVGFIQDWYNLYRVKPMAKTVVPVFARLLAHNNVWEVKRLLQILDSMEGGLSPVTELWLEKRLAAVGKTVDDLRVR